MKKLFAIGMAFLVTAGLMTSCGAAPQADETGQNTQVIELDSGSPPSEDELVPDEPDAFGADIDYMDYIYPLGVFLDGATWSEPGALPASNYAEWYITYLRDIESASLNGYKLEDEEGFRIPQKELETAVAKYFGISSDTLRADEEVYSAEDEAYILRKNIPNAAHSISLKKVEESGNSCTLSFVITTNSIRQERILKVAADANGFKYLSYVSGH